MATTWYGGTPGEVLVDDGGRGYAGLQTDLFTDKLFTTPASVVNEAGDGVGGTVTAGVGGRIRFGDPAGGTATLYSPARYRTVAGVTQPDPTGGFFEWRPATGGTGGGGSTVTTSTRADGAPTLVVT